MTETDQTYVSYDPDLLPLDCHGLRVVQLPRQTEFDPLQPSYDLVGRKGSVLPIGATLTSAGRLTALARGADE